MRWRTVRFKILDFSPAATRMANYRLRYRHEHGRWPDDAPVVRDTLYRMACLGQPYVERVDVSPYRSTVVAV